MSGPGSPDPPIPASGVLSKAEILTHIGEVADEFAARDLADTLVVVGGSYMALHDLRESTADVDTLTKLTEQLKTVVRAVAAPAPKRTTPDPPSAEEAAATLNEAWKQPAWGTLLWVVMVTGFRRGELCSVRWAHVELGRGRISITPLAAAFIEMN
jgi:integrase